MIQRKIKRYRLFNRSTQENVAIQMRQVASKKSEISQPDKQYDQTESEADLGTPSPSLDQSPSPQSPRPL